MSKHEFVVKGMHCKSCRMLVEDILEDAGATNIKVDLDEANKKGAVSFESDKTPEELANLIKEEADYEVE